MFLVIGESLVDLINEPGSWRFEATAGGSPLNVALGLAATGAPVRFASEVGDDLFGELIGEQLRRYRVAPDALVRTPTTSLAVARTDPAGVASYHFRFGWAWPGPAPLAQVGWVHTGSLAAVVEPGASAVRAALAAAARQGVPISYDPNVRPALMGEPATARARVEQLVALAGVVKASGEDLAWLYPGVPEHTVARQWAARGPWLVVVTRGEAGTLALHRGTVIECTAPPVSVVDTVGAGDAFTAGLLARLAPGGATTAGGAEPAVPEAVRYACATAAAVCAHRGAAPPTGEAIAALLPQAHIR